MKRTASQASLFLDELIQGCARSEADAPRSDPSFGGPMDFAELRSLSEACERSVVQLFALVAQHCPEVLPGVWATLYDVIAAEERLWVYPSVNHTGFRGGLLA